ncbi:MAG: hypothetical protein KGL39_48985 [Patescibacteria group bacterium]|nr:hypothetical protein [Patescibacteria group bacterium]
MPAVHDHFVQCSYCGKPYYPRSVSDTTTDHPCCVWWAKFEPKLPCQACAASNMLNAQRQRRAAYYRPDSEEGPDGP